MNCQAVQNQIIALSDPRQLSPGLLAHVAGCAGCREWARRAARLETLLEQLPVPPAPAEKKEALIGDLLAAEPVIRPMAVPATRPGLVTVAGRFLQRNGSYVGGLAAAVLVAVGAWYAIKPTPRQPEFVESQRHPLLERIATRNVAMARTDSPAKRLEVLGGMAEDLAGETRGMARVASPAELKDLARWYDKVVKDGLVRQAKELPVHALTPTEKRKLMDGLAAKLDADAAEADRLSREVPQDAQPTLKRIADTARDGARELSRQGN